MTSTWSDLALRRARRTAELAGFPDAQQEPLAVEWDYGDYEGISSDLIRKDNPDYLIWTHGVPNGEALDEVAARADKIVARVLESGLDNVLIVAHGHFPGSSPPAGWDWPTEGRHFILGTAKVCTLAGIRRPRQWSAGAYKVTIYKII